jgi:dienelactone hydrolase
MTDHSVFIPSGGEHLAATITTPEAPRGLVVLSTGIGAPRSHRFQMWARLADRLAEAGIASVRWEYPGMHDSTGTVVRPMLTEDWLPQLRSVVEFARRTLGQASVISVGNCIGGSLGLQLAAEVTWCEGVIALMPPAVPLRRIEAGMGKVLGARGRSILRSAPVGRRAVALVRSFAAPSAGVGLLSAALRNAPVLVLADQEWERDPAHAPFVASIARVPDSLRHRLEVRILEGAGLDRFASVASQTACLDVMAGWIERIVGSRAGLARGHAIGGS